MKIGKKRIHQSKGARFLYFRELLDKDALETEVKRLEIFHSGKYLLGAKTFTPISRDAELS